MSQTVSGSIDPVIRLILADSDGVVSVPDPIVTGGAFATLKRTFTNGTGANKLNKLWRKRSTLAAAANNDWVLRGGSNVLDRFGNVISFTSVALVIVRVVSPATTKKVRLGAAAANPWTGWFGAIAHTEEVQTWSIKVADIDRWAVAANETLRVNNPTAASLDYDIIIGGQG